MAQYFKFYGTFQIFCIRVFVCRYLIACIYAHTRIVYGRMWFEAAAPKYDTAAKQIAE